MQSVSPEAAAQVFFEACEWLPEPLSAPKLAAVLRTTSRAGFRVGSALSNFVESYREVSLLEGLPPRWKVGVLAQHHGRAEEGSICAVHRGGGAGLRFP